MENVKKNKAVKLISGILLIAIMAPSIFLAVPEQADAQWITHDPLNGILHALHLTQGTITAGATTTDAGANVTNTSLHWADILKEIARQLIMAFERKLLQKMTQATVNWINSGFHGSPLFVQDPGAFFTDIGKSEIKTLITLTGYDPNKFPFGESLALGMINNYKRQLSDNLQYSMSQVIRDPVFLSSCRTNFNTCGWNGFLINSQYPQNNYLGYGILVNNQLANKLQGTVQNTAQKVQTSLNQAGGFLSPKSCPSNPAYNNGINEFQAPVFVPPEFSPPYKTQDEIDESPDPAQAQLANEQYRIQYDTLKAGAQAQFNSPTGLNYCPGGLQVTTPGSVAANQIMTAMSSTYRQSELASALGNSIGAILDALLNHFLDQGLTALGGLVTGSPSTDNFSYQNQTLTGQPPAGPAVSGSLIVSMGSVSMSVNDISPTTVNIVGGVTPYSIKTQPDPAIATADLFGSSLTITSIGVSSTPTSVTIQDSSTTPQTITIPITVGVAQSTGDPLGTCVDVMGTQNLTEAVCKTAGGSWTPGTTNTPPVILTPPTITADPSIVSVNAGSAGSTTVYNGTAPFSIIIPPYENIATASIENIDGSAGIYITGISPGSTSVRVEDSSTPAQTVGIDIEIQPSLSSGTGGCFVNGQIVQDVTTESDCNNILDAQWIASP